MYTPQHTVTLLLQLRGLPQNRSTGESVNKVNCASCVLACLAHIRNAMERYKKKMRKVYILISMMRHKEIQTALCIRQGQRHALSHYLPAQNTPRKEFTGKQVLYLADDGLFAQCHRNIYCLFLRKIKTKTKIVTVDATMRIKRAFERVRASTIDGWKFGSIT